MGFTVDEGKLGNVINECTDAGELIRSVRNSLGNAQSYYEIVKDSIIDNLATVDENIIQVYSHLSTLATLASNVLNAAKEEEEYVPNNGEYSVNKSIWDFEQFGGRQSELAGIYERYLAEGYDSLSDYEKNIFDTMKTVFDSHGISEEDRPLWVNQLSAGGCGLVSAANIIASVYSQMPNGSQKFEDKYGFPLSFNLVNPVDNSEYTNYNYNNLALSLLFDYCDVEQENIEDFDGIHMSFLQKTVEAQSTENVVTFRTDLRSDVDFFGSDPVDKYNETFDTYPYAIVSAPAGTTLFFTDEYNNTMDMPLEDSGHAVSAVGSSNNGCFLVSQEGRGVVELTGSELDEYLFIGADVGGD